MTCSSCSKPMFVILVDRAFCEACYRELQERQRRIVEDFPRKKALPEMVIDPKELL